MYSSECCHYFYEKCAISQLLGTNPLFRFAFSHCHQPKPLFLMWASFATKVAHMTYYDDVTTMENNGQVCECWYDIGCDINFVLVSEL